VFTVQYVDCVSNLSMSSVGGKQCHHSTSALSLFAYRVRALLPTKPIQAQKRAEEAEPELFLSMINDMPSQTVLRIPWYHYSQTIALSSKLAETLSDYKKQYKKILMLSNSGVTNGVSRSPPKRLLLFCFHSQQIDQTLSWKSTAQQLRSTSQPDFWVSSLINV